MKLNLSIDMTETETMTLMTLRQATQQTQTETTETEQQMDMSNAHTATEPHTEQPTNETETKTAAEETANETEETADEYVNYFDKVVRVLAEMPSEPFMELVKYAMLHGNRFPEYSNYKDIVNADDAYCSALIKLTRLWSEDVEKKAFEVFNSYDDSVIKMLTVLKSASTAVRDSGGDLQTFFCLKKIVDAYMSTL